MREAEIIKRFNDVWKVLGEIEGQRRRNVIQMNKVTIVQNALLKVFILVPPIKFIIQCLVRKEEKLQKELTKKEMIKQWEEQIKEKTKKENIKL